MSAITTKSPDETGAAAGELARSLTGGELILLQGGLGAGKTTFVRGLAAGLDSDDHVSSPTFVLENIYRGRIDLLHIDLYRTTESDLIHLDIEEARADGMVVVIEWSEKLPQGYRTSPLIVVDLREVLGSPNDREIVVEANP